VPALTVPAVLDHKAELLWMLKKERPTRGSPPDAARAAGRAVMDSPLVGDLAFLVLAVMVSVLPTVASNTLLPSLPAVAADFVLVTVSDRVYGTLPPHTPTTTIRQPLFVVTVLRHARACLCYFRVQPSTRKSVSIS
jgi:hypothetical protein